MTRAQILSGMKEAVLLASKAIRDIARHGFEVETKDDGSPVTEADLASDRTLRSLLSLPGIGYLSEEEKDDFSRLSLRSLFIVDPLDGTSDFVLHDGSYGINVAYIEDHRPVLSVIGIPEKHLIAFSEEGKGSYLQEEGKEPRRIRVSDRRTGLTALTSRTHPLKEDEDLLRRHKDLIAQVLSAGACTKAVLLSEGKADVSVRHTDQTKEWDVAAPDLLVREAGGVFVDGKGRPFTYNRRDVYNHDGYAMFNSEETARIFLS